MIRLKYLNVLNHQYVNFAVTKNNLNENFTIKKFLPSVDLDTAAVGIFGKDLDMTAFSRDVVNLTVDKLFVKCQLVRICKINSQSHYFFTDFFSLFISLFSKIVVPIKSIVDAIHQYLLPFSPRIKKRIISTVCPIMCAISNFLFITSLPQRGY